MTEVEATLLLIEDDLQTRRFLRMTLLAQSWEVIESETGRLGLDLFKMRKPDLVILDLGLPDMDGVSVVKALRQLSDLPVLILSARSREKDKIQALDAGADDYLTKPFSTGELEARIRALLRRAARPGTGRDAFQTGALRVDCLSRRVYVAEREIHLTPIEFRLLSILVRQAGLVVTQKQLLREVWGPAHVEDSHYLRVYMGQLRHKLEADPARPRYLLTELGVGYRLALTEPIPEDCPSCG